MTTERTAYPVWRPVVLLGVFACWWLVPHRGACFEVSLLIHSVATGVFLWCCAPVLSRTPVSVPLWLALAGVIGLRRWRSPWGPS